MVPIVLNNKYNKTATLAKLSLSSVIILLLTIIREKKLTDATNFILNSRLKKSEQIEYHYTQPQAQFVANVNHKKHLPPTEPTRTPPLHIHFLTKKGGGQLLPNAKNSSCTH